MWRVMVIVGCVVGVWPMAGYAASYVPISVSLAATTDGNPVPRPGALSGPDEVMVENTYPPGYHGQPFSLKATSQTNLGDTGITLDLRTSGTGWWPDAGWGHTYASATVLFRLTQPVQIYLSEEEDNSWYPGIGASGMMLTGSNGDVRVPLGGPPVTVPPGDYTFSCGAYDAVDHGFTRYGYMRVTLEIVPEPGVMVPVLAAVTAALLRRVPRRADAHR